MKHSPKCHRLGGKMSPQKSKDRNNRGFSDLNGIILNYFMAPENTKGTFSSSLREVVLKLVQ